MQAWNAQLMAQVQSLREDLARKDQIILQLNRITSRFSPIVPTTPSAFHLFNWGGSIIAVVRSVVSSLRKKISALKPRTRKCRRL
ncbi:MAG: hypothetical protein R3F31_05500 [Verrucomicrobiales bacterium]